MKGGRQKAEGRRGSARSAGSSFILHPSFFAICVALAAGFGGAGGAWAQIVTDPTRPPGAYATGDPDAGSDVGGGPVLQSVMISPTRKAAIISGEMVGLGEKYGDAVLVKIAENEVVLKSGDALQVLRMYPGVEKRDAAPAAPKRAPRRGKSSRSAEPAAAGGEPAR